MSADVFSVALMAARFNLWLRPQHHFSLVAASTNDALGTPDTAPLRHVAV